jgi:hypothetical protein
VGWDAGHSYKILTVINKLDFIFNFTGFSAASSEFEKVKLLKISGNLYEFTIGQAPYIGNIYQVLAAVYGPHDMRDSRLRPIQDKVVVNCQYSMAVFRY